MTAILVTWIANSVAIYFVAYLLRSLEVPSWRTAFLAGAVLSLINAIVKPILVILTLPLTLITLGLFYFVITAFCLYLASQLVPGFIVHGKFMTLVAAVLISIISAFINRLLTNATADPNMRNMRIR
jgi:putative membrane protein